MMLKRCYCTTKQWRRRRRHSTTFLGNQEIHKCGLEGKLGPAIAAFECLASPNLFSWNLVISACVRNGAPRDALLFFHRMHFPPDRFTLLPVLEALGSLSDLPGVRKIRSVASAVGLGSDLSVQTALVDALGRCGRPEEAVCVFETIPSPVDVVAWSAAVEALASNGCGREALSLFHRMRTEGPPPNCVTFLSALDACTSLPDVKTVHSLIVAAAAADNNSPLDTVLLTSLTHIYGQFNHLPAAISTFRKIPHPNIVSFTTLMSVYTQTGHPHLALRLFHSIQSSGLTPNKVTFLIALDACSNSASPPVMGRILHLHIIAAKLDSNPTINSALLHMYGRCGNHHDALQLFFANTHQTETVSWNAMITAHAHNAVSSSGSSSKCPSELLSQMDLAGVSPNRITFLCIFNACSHVGLLDEAWNCFISMSLDYDILQSAEHFGCLIDLIRRGAQLVEAEDFIRNMPVQPDAVTWSALLGAWQSNGKP